MIWSKVKAEFKALRYSIYHRIAFSLKNERETVSAFHKLYYDAANQGRTWRNTQWMGVPVGKCPLDLWAYQELIYELKPDLIIETGTYFGGSAYYFAGLLDLLNKGRLISIDTETLGETLAHDSRSPKKARPEHPRIEYWQGSSVSEQILAKLRAIVSQSPVVLVTLDSDHRKEHVLNELRAYQSFVTPGSYLVVEDTNLNGHPVYPEFGPGPWEALSEFLLETNDFEIDSETEQNQLMTMHPRGFLRKKVR